MKSRFKSSDQIVQKVSQNSNRSFFKACPYSVSIVVTTSQSRTNCNILDIRGGETLEELSENLTLTDLGAGSQHNLSCAGVNSVGEGEYDAVELLVYGKRERKNKNNNLDFNN